MYLGRLLTEDGNTEKEISRPVGMIWKANTDLRGIGKKVKLWTSVVLPVKVMGVSR